MHIFPALKPIQMFHVTQPKEGNFSTETDLWEAANGGFTSYKIQCFTYFLHPA